MQYRIERDSGSWGGGEGEGTLGWSGSINFPPCVLTAYPWPQLLPPPPTPEVPYHISLQPQTADIEQLTAFIHTVVFLSSSLLLCFSLY